MTCDQSRDEYISAIEDVAAITRYVAEQTAAYLALVRSAPVSRLGQHAEAREKMKAAVERLVAEERVALERYRRDAKLHPSPVPAMGAMIPVRQATG